MAVLEIIEKNTEHFIHALQSYWYILVCNMQNQNNQLKQSEKSDHCITKFF